MLVAHRARAPYSHHGVAVDQVLIDRAVHHADEKLMIFADRLVAGASVAHLFDPVFYCLPGDATGGPVAPFGEYPVLGL